MYVQALKRSSPSSCCCFSSNPGQLTRFPPLSLGTVSISEAYVKVSGKSAFLVNSRFSEYANSFGGGHDPMRERRLLLHKGEARQIQQVSVFVKCAYSDTSACVTVARLLASSYALLFQHSVNVPLRSERRQEGDDVRPPENVLQRRRPDKT